MKYKLLTFLLLISQAIYPQQNQTLQNEIQQLHTAFNEIDLEKISTMLCSKESTDDIYQKLDTYFLNDQTKFRFVFRNLKANVIDLKESGNISYKRVTFNNMIRITYFHPIDEAELTRIQNSLKEKFKAKMIKYEKARNSFLVEYEARLIAISEADNKWKFAFADNTLPIEISDSCLSEEVKKHLSL